MRLAVSAAETSSAVDPGARRATRVLVAHASRHGATRAVAEALAERLAQDAIRAEAAPAATVTGLEGVDAVVLGSALYSGCLHRDARRFLARHRATLAGLPLAVLALGPRTLDEAHIASSRAQLDAALVRFSELAPVSVAVVDGVVDPSTLHFPFSRLPASDARDWEAIGRWAVTLLTSSQMGSAERPVGERR